MLLHHQTHVIMDDIQQFSVDALLCVHFCLTRSYVGLLAVTHTLPHVKPNAVQVSVHS
jgi:hypothetical protein